MAATTVDYMPTMRLHITSEADAPVVLSALHGKHRVLEFSGYPSTLDHIEYLLRDEDGGWCWQRSEEEGYFPRLMAWRDEEETLRVWLHLSPEDDAGAPALLDRTLRDDRYDSFQFLGPAHVITGARMRVPPSQFDTLVLPYDCMAEGWQQLCVTRRRVVPLPSVPLDAPHQLTEAVSKMTLRSSSAL